MLGIKIVWERIQKHAGTDTEFDLFNGKPFSYEAVENYIIPFREECDLKEHNISKNAFKKGLEFVPCSRPGKMHNVWAKSYVWAILHDKRIRRGDW